MTKNYMGHWWVIIACCPLTNDFLLTNWTTFSPKKEQTCILKTGDHPSIIHDSAIMYYYTRTFTETQLDQLISNENWIKLSPVNSTILSKIRQKALETKRMNPVLQSRFKPYLI